MSACGTSCDTATRWLRAALPDSRTRLCSGIWACGDCAMFTWGRVREPLVKSVGKPDARNGHVRFDERGRETAGCSYPGTAPFLDSTAIRGGGWFWPLSRAGVRLRSRDSRAGARNKMQVQAHAWRV